MELNDKLIPVAQYVRMSTDHQNFSTENQINAISEYAKNNKMKIIKTYADDGKSGLKLEGRLSLQTLIADVQSGNIKFKKILVYDVTRWGRFQNPDESAYFEYSLIKCGVEIEYCAEQFRNDGSTVSTIIKNLKRTMAGEYSRELSTKVFLGQCNLIKKGFKQGGTAGFGLRRMLIDEAGNEKGILNFGERKSIQTDRVILTKGPEAEVEIVNHIFKLFVTEGKSEKDISTILNNKSIKTDLNRAWSSQTIKQILSNEKYIGNNIFNKKSFKLKGVRQINPSKEWVRKDNAFEPIVPPELFFKAVGVLLERSRRYSNEELLEKLKEIYSKKSKLSGIIIDEFEDTPSSSVYRNRFGSLIRAYSLVGYIPEKDFQYLELNKLIKGMYPGIIEQVMSNISEFEGSIICQDETDSFLVNEEYSFTLTISRCKLTGNGNLRWKVFFNKIANSDINIVIRLKENNQDILDYFILPTIDNIEGNINFGQNNGAFLDTYRFDELDYFYTLSKRNYIKELS